MRTPIFLLASLVVATLTAPAASQGVHEGVIPYSDGSRYEGDVVDGKPHGRGVLIYSNGRRLSGSWANGKWIPGSPQLELRPSEIRAPSNQAAASHTQVTSPTVPVPADTPLTKLPEGSRIIVKTGLTTEQQWGNDGDHRKVLYGKGSGWITVGRKNVAAGTVWPIQSVNSTSQRSLILLAGDSGRVWFSQFDGTPPQTVDDFNDRLGSYFQIVYDNPHYDPYPGMDKGTVTDILMAKITAALDTNDYAKALPHFAQLEKLGVSLPESFHFYYAKSLDNAGKKAEARVRAEAYVKTFGRQGKYYAQIIEIMSRM